MCIEVTIYSTDDAFSVKAKRFNKMFTSILAFFFLLRIANKSHFYAPNVVYFLLLLSHRQACKIGYWLSMQAG